jgi:hypothetical protein
LRGRAWPHASRTIADARSHRRRSLDHRQECWLIYYGDIHAGTITERVGNPHATGRREWRCGFYPGSNPGEHQSGTAATFGEARANFEGAWKFFCQSEPRPIFGHGAISGIGPLRNIGALIAASACPTIGGPAANAWLA